MLLDKSMILNHWSIGLYGENSTLSTPIRNKMIDYAIHDCFATTCLPRPIRHGRKRSDTPFSGHLRQLLTVYNTTKNGRNTITTKWALYTP